MPHIGEHSLERDAIWTGERWVASWEMQDARRGHAIHKEMMFHQRQAENQMRRQMEQEKAYMQQASAQQGLSQYMPQGGLLSGVHSGQISTNETRAKNISNPNTQPPETDPVVLLLGGE